MRTATTKTKKKFTRGPRKPLPNGWLRPSQAAAKIGISRAAMYQLMDAGEIGFHNFGPKNRRISKEQFDKFVRESKRN